MQKSSSENTTAMTASRQWQILSQLDRKRWLGTAKLKEQLHTAGFDVSLRTIQRDLNALAKRFPLEKNNTTPQGWRWQENAPLQSLPQMSLPQAVAFNMVEVNLAQLLPPAVLQELKPWFELANRQINSNHHIADNWLDRVKIIPPTQPLIAPNIDNHIQTQVYTALFEQKQLQTSYYRRGEKHSTDYILNPLAIVQKGVIIYILATRADDPKHTIKTFALHRFAKVKCSKINAYTPKGFDLNQHIDSGALGFRYPDIKQKSAKISLTFTPQAGISLLESQLSEDQSYEQDENRITITATVNITSQLIWWLRGFGKGLLNIQPDFLADAVYERNIHAPTYHNS